MIDIKDIVPAECDECGDSIGEGVTPAPRTFLGRYAYTIRDRGDAFCSYSCAEQFVNNHNVDEAEMKGEGDR